MEACHCACFRFRPLHVWKGRACVWRFPALMLAAHALRITSLRLGRFISICSGARAGGGGVQARG